MDSPNRFCSYCGKPLGPAARFCGACGKPVPAASTPAPVPTAPAPAAPAPIPTPPVPAAPARPAEAIIGVIPWVMRRTGTLGMKIENYTLVVTPQRLIFALLTKEGRNENLRNAQEQAKAEGKNVFQRIGAQMNADNGAAYFNMSPDAALAENPANFYLLNQQVESAKITSYDDGEGGVTTYYLELKGGFGKMKFELGRLNERAARQVLHQALGAAMR